MSMFFISVKSCEVKRRKIDKHMKFGLYRQLIINFQEPKLNSDKPGNVCKNFNLW